MTNYLEKDNLSDFTKKEFLAFVTRISNAEGETGGDVEIDVDHFDKVVPHPNKSDLLYWPPEGLKLDTPEEIVSEIERYCKENNLPCFKPDK